MSRRVKGRSISLAQSRSLLDASHSPLCASLALVETALERAEAELSITVSTSVWKPDGSEWQSFPTPYQRAPGNHTLASGRRARESYNLQDLVQPPLGNAHPDRYP